jgi:acylphosphatase
MLVRGSVQKVGYRDLVQEEAVKLGVKGFVENLKDGQVRIVCEADEDSVGQLIERIKVREELVYVESIDVVKTGPATGEFQYFEIKYGTLEEELGERMVAAVKYAKAMWSDIREVKTDMREVKVDIKEMKTDIKEVKTDIKEMKTDIREMKADIKEVKEDIREMKTDIKEMKTDIKEMKGDLKEVKTDVKSILVKQDELVGEVRGVRDDLKTYMGMRFERLERDVALIKEKLGLG